MGGGEKIAFLIDKGFGICHKARRSAGVAELVDAPDSKSGEGDLVSVRFRSSVFKEHFKCEVLFISERILCRGGGTGRRTRLKIWRGRPRIGSIPILGIQRALQMRSALFFWLLRDRFCDVAIWRAVRCEVLFFLAFEGSFLRRRRLEGSSMRSALFFWLLRDRFCDVAVWGGERQKK